MFDRFYHRVVIRAEMIAATALYIGTGENAFKPSAVKGPLLRNASSQPYIPGSSIKGVLRSFLESVLAPRGTACYMGKGCTELYNDGIKRKNLLHDMEKIAKLDFGTAYREEHARAYAAEMIEAVSCPACRLFGSGQLAGKVKVADATLMNADVPFTPDVRTGVAIDRDTHTAVPKALYDMETIPVGTRFSLRIVAENLTHEESKVLGGLLQHFAMGGLLLGGRIRSGLGGICIEQFNITLTAREPREFPVTRELEPLAANCIGEKLTELLNGAEAPPPQKREASQYV